MKILNLLLQQALKGKSDAVHAFMKILNLPYNRFTGEKWITVYAFHINIEFVMTQVKVNE